MDRMNLPKMAIFGAGGLGIEMIKLLTQRQAVNLVAILDKSGYVYNPAGINLEQAYNTLAQTKDVMQFDNATASQTSIQDFMNSHGQDIDCVFYALPNIPNTFIPDITEYIATQTQFKGVIVDALKRTSAVKLLTNIADKLKQANILYLTGCGATPGLLTTAASVAAQSFVEITSVNIEFGVGISNWQAYRATIREDIAHMPGYNVQKASELSEQDIDNLLDETNGLITLVNMEHADDIMLEMAGICSADKVTVGGTVDTRNPEKPVSTNVKITGKTYQGLESTHQFILGDETSMAANVNGTALGYINAGMNLYQEYQVVGLKTAADILPKFAPTVLTKVNILQAQSVMS